MANAVTTQTLIDGNRNYAILLTGQLDTSNEAAAAKVDVSTLGPAAAGCTVDNVKYSISGSLKVVLAWDATTDVPFAVLSGQGEMCFRDIGGLRNNAGAGKTGDVMLSTVGWASGIETYTVLISGRKEYA